MNLTQNNPCDQHGAGDVTNIYDREDENKSIDG